MKYRTFGKTSWKVSEVSLGCWQLGGVDWGTVSAADAHQVLTAAADGGVNFFDTADVYGLGQSESHLGKFLSGREEQMWVATKLGRFPEPGWPQNFEFDTMKAHAAASVKRLQRETLDLLQLHCVPTDVLKEGAVFESLRRLKQEGLIREFGVSVESMDEALLCLEQEGLASLQIIFNLFRQKPIEVLFDAAQAKEVALIVRLPLASGLFSGRMNKDTRFAESDHRSYNRNGEAFNVGETFAGIEFETAVNLVRDLRGLIPMEWSLPEIALRWCLDHPAVTTVIPGAKRPEQVRQNLAASERGRLGDSYHKALAAFYKARVAHEVRGPY